MPKGVLPSSKSQRQPWEVSARETAASAARIRETIGTYQLRAPTSDSWSELEDDAALVELEKLRTHESDRVYYNRGGIARIGTHGKRDLWEWHALPRCFHFPHSAHSSHMSFFILPIESPYNHRDVIFSVVARIRTRRGHAYGGWSSEEMQSLPVRSRRRLKMERQRQRHRQRLCQRQRHRLCQRHHPPQPRRPRYVRRRWVSWRGW